MTYFIATRVSLRRGMTLVLHQSTADDTDLHRCCFAEFLGPRCSAPVPPLQLVVDVERQRSIDSLVCTATVECVCRVILPLQQGVKAEPVAGLLDCQSREDAAGSAFGI